MANTTQKMALSPRQTFNGQRVRRIPGCAVKIATWNVRSMYTCEKYTNVIQEMQRLNIDVLGISDSRLKGTDVKESDDTITYYSGSDDEQHMYGVAVIIKKHLKNSVLNFVPASDRVMLLQLKAKPANINIIQVYAPTGAKSQDGSINPFYNEIRQVLHQLKAHECNIVIGDFNAKMTLRRVPLHNFRGNRFRRSISISYLYDIYGMLNFSLSSLFSSNCLQK
ncbi:unnamed protein product [Euphydryas editha]|uniref:Endonuclease/exonuclease/phosphatase domain-containing protein n=1 Tax=Euphydryas editha TaxID=104508 RepID=A0AAU9VCL1_EUPED|nr:unnamed protein product [Euphydryas editha]